MFAFAFARASRPAQGAVYCNLVLLIGQYDSPFVASVNPLRRVPTLLLDDGECLLESFSILDALDQMVGPECALIAASGAPRRKALGICALARGVADKCVSLFYEPLLRAQPSAIWIERCRRQIRDGLGVLERERAQVSSAWWCGPTLGHADIAVACMLRSLREAHPGLFDAGLHPMLSRHAERCEALSAFPSVVQPLTVAISS